ncbi:4'-phosphopantetheinyl transferase family protein [Bacillus atrophaeus]|uniref:4'-phosphopantetheinyl transferase family protein n=1 Tax=Bacillus atrophaeus TaxID=1452 RepID=UPI0012FD43AC|nr:hypothetical protein [Bacillus atrophaeus]
MGEILARYAISKLKGYSFKELTFTTNYYGKPFLESYENDCYFNISHSGEWVVCAIDKGHIGINIERIAPIKLDIAKRFFTDEEYQDLKKKTARCNYSISMIYGH